MIGQVAHTWADFKTVAMGESSKWNHFLNGDLGSELSSHSSSLQRGNLGAATSITKRFWELWPLLGHVWGSFSWGLTQPSAKWFIYFTMEPLHAHVYLSRILLCVLNKKRKRIQMQGMVVLIVGWECCVWNQQHILAENFEKTLWVTVRVWSPKWSHSSLWQV